MKSVAPESRDLQVALRWNSWRHNQGHDNALFVIERRCINSSFFNRLLCHCNTLTALESSKFIMLKGKNVGGFTLTVNFICPLVLIFTEKALLFLNFTPSNSLLTKNISLMKKKCLYQICDVHVIRSGRVQVFGCWENTYIYINFVHTTLSSDIVSIFYAPLWNAYDLIIFNLCLSFSREPEP